MSALAVEGLGKTYGEAAVVADVSLAIAEGEFVSLLGPSGCGKTTILRMVAGLIAPSRGRILLGRDDVTALPPNRRGLGLVFQSYALFPHLTVFENVAFGLRRQGVAGTALAARVADALALVRLAEYGARYPRQLSGGQQQRIAIARALAPRPRVLLLDEPLSNLDAQLREDMQIELKRLQRNLGVTTLFVTHDQAEALSMSDRVCVMAKGVVQQFATPEDIYRRPATGFVAGFIGRPNRLAATVAARDGAGGLLRLGEALTLPATRLDAPAGTRVDIVIRQEAIGLSPTPGPGSIPATIAFRSFGGARLRYVVKLASDVELVAERASSEPAFDIGDAVAVTIAPADIFAAPAGGAAA